MIRIVDSSYNNLFAVPYVGYGCANAETCTSTGKELFCQLVAEEYPQVVSDLVFVV